MNRKMHLQKVAKAMCLATVAMCFFSCSTTKHLKADEYLLDKNIIKVEPGALKSELAPIIKQKPNRKIAGIVPFNLWLYNQIDQDKLLKRKEKRDLRFARINVTRLERNEKRNARRAKKGKEKVQVYRETAL